MKRFFHLFAVIALLLANAGTEVHANCFGAGCGGETTSSVSVNHGHDHENVSSKQDSKGTCDTCLQHHHHTANIIPAIKPAYFMTSLHIARDWEAASLMPSQHYPPLQASKSLIPFLIHAAHLTMRHAWLFTGITHLELLIMYRYYGLGALCVALAALAQPVWAQETNHAPTATHKHMDGTSHSSDERARLLTLQDALEKALSASPRIKSAEQAVNAARGAEAQASYWPNPELQFQAENIAGQGQYSGIDGAEMTYGLSQEIEIAGKRGYRQQAAANSVGMQRLDLQASKLNLIRDVRIAYAEAVAAQATLALADERRELAEELLATVNRRVKAAREPEIQLRKADITVNAARVAYGQAAREFTHTKHVLSSLWAGHHEGYLLDDSSFYTLTAPPKEQDVETALAEAPALKRWESETQRRETLLELEKANRLPNPRITAGVRDLREDGEQAFVLGVSMPIPVWNGNAGNITRAHHEALQAESQSMAASIALRNQAFQFLEEMVNAYEEANTLKENIIPAAEQSFTLAREGYRLGKFPYLEVLDSQRTLFEVKAQYITAMQAYHTARAEVERLTTSAPEGADHAE